MKVIVTQNIDNFDVVIEIQSADGYIDPVATEKIVKEKIKEEKIYKDIEKIKKQIHTYAVQANKAKINATKNSLTANDKKKFTNEYILRKGQMEEEMVKLVEPAKEFEKRYRELMFEHAVYFNVQSDKFIVSDADGIEFENLMKQATQENSVVDKNKKIIPNNKGKIYFIKKSGKWSKFSIDKLNLVPEIGSILESNLTEKQIEEIRIQFENDRISALNTSEKEAEKELKYNNLVTQAVQMKNELEIVGDKEALVKSRSWLSEESEKLDLIYG